MENVDVNELYEIEDCETSEIGRLYSELQDVEIGSEKYKEILNAIKIIRSCYNDGNRYWIEKDKMEHDRSTKTEEFRIEREKIAQAKAQLEHETELKKAELKAQKNDLIGKIALGVLGTGVTLTMWWVTLKFNVNLGSITTKDAIAYIVGKRKAY